VDSHQSLIHQVSFPHDKCGKEVAVLYDLMSQSLFIRSHFLTKQAEIQHQGRFESQSLIHQVSFPHSLEMPRLQIRDKVAIPYSSGLISSLIHSLTMRTDAVERRNPLFIRSHFLTLIVGAVEMVFVLSQSLIHQVSFPH